MTTQLDASIGIAPETTFGTGVTVDRHYEFLSESLAYEQQFLQGAGLRVGSRFPRAARRSVGQVNVSGAIGFEVFSRGFGRILQAALGTATSTQIAATTAYQQVHTPATTDPLKSYTIQKGIPPIGGGATLPFTYTGMLCNSLELTVAVNEILQCNTEWVGQDMTTATAYATPTYPLSTNGNIFTFKDAKLVLGGTVTAPSTTVLATGGTQVAAITAASVKVENDLQQAFYIGGSGRIGRPGVIGPGSAISGQFTAEFLDGTFVNSYLQQTDLALVLTLQSSVAIAASNYPTVQVYVPNVRITGEIPKANGGQPVTLTLPFVGLDNSVAAAPIYVCYVTADTAV